MWILDITSLLSTGELNYYVFNPSIVNCNNTYVIVYRIASYDLSTEYHPWKIWDNGYKFFKNGREAALTKYRDTLGGPIKHKLVSVPIIQKHPEYDSTGLAIATFNNGFHIKHNIANLFPDEMNQDARIVYNDGLFTIIYNVFENGGLKLRYREFIITADEVLLSNERYLFNHIYRSVEKHCTYGIDKHIIQYGIGSSYDNIIDGVMNKSPMAHFDYLYNKYGRTNVLISLSTPLVSYKEKYIGCGHIKIQYKQIKLDLLSGIELSGFKMHGKYIYFMFLYETDGYSITRVSPAFIPTVNNCHFPYLLVMPIGMTILDDKYLISYGEGDCKCKCLILNSKEIDQLLNAQSLPCFLTRKLQIQHVGYWEGMNCGDDAYKDVFRWLYKNTPHNVTFSTDFAAAANLNVLGGGDVINNYFIKSTIPNNCIAVSVGIPYMEFAKLLPQFKSVYLRNKFDQAQQSNTKYIPDLTFLLPQIYGKTSTREPKKTIGVILARTYYNEDYVDLYNDFCNEMSVFVNMAHDSGFHIVFIPFCISKKKSFQNDLIIISDICNKLKFRAEVFYPGHDYVRDIYFKVSQMDFNICTRFHAHIFSTIHSVPFISLTCGRKCIEYMKHIPSCLFRLNSNHIDLPIDFDGRIFYDFFIEKWANRQYIKQKLNKLNEDFTAKINVFARDYPQIISKYSSGAELCLWMPEKVYTSSPPLSDASDQNITVASKKNITSKAKPRMIQPAAIKHVSITQIDHTKSVKLPTTQQMSTVLPTVMPTAIQQVPTMQMSTVTPTTIQQVPTVMPTTIQQVPTMQLPTVVPTMIPTMQQSGFICKPIMQNTVSPTPTVYYHAPTPVSSSYTLLRPSNILTSDSQYGMYVDTCSQNMQQMSTVVPTIQQMPTMQLPTVVPTISTAHTIQQVPTMQMSTAMPTVVPTIQQVPSMMHTVQMPTMIPALQQMSTVVPTMSAIQQMPTVPTMQMSTAIPTMQQISTTMPTIQLPTVVPTMIRVQTPAALSHEAAFSTINMQNVSDFGTTSPGF